MKTYALDTGFFVLYFAGDENAKKIYEEVRKGSSRGFTLETNMAELYYKTCQKLGLDVAKMREKSIRYSVIEVKEIDEKISRKAGEIKCKIRDISLADVLLAAAATIYNAVVVTTDEDFLKIRNLKVSVLPFPK